MKIVLEQEILGPAKTTRSCICIYDSAGILISFYWLNDADDPYNAMKITKALLESCINRFGWDCKSNGIKETILLYACL